MNYCNICITWTFRRFQVFLNILPLIPLCCDASFGKWCQMRYKRALSFLFLCVKCRNALLYFNQGEKKWKKNTLDPISCLSVNYLLELQVCLKANKYKKVSSQIPFFYGWKIQTFPTKCVLAGDKKEPGCSRSAEMWPGMVFKYKRMEKLKRKQFFFFLAP